VQENLATGAPLRTPLGELTAFPRPLAKNLYRRSRPFPFGPGLWPFGASPLTRNRRLGPSQHEGLDRHRQHDVTRLAYTVNTYVKMTAWRVLSIEDGDRGEAIVTRRSIAEGPRDASCQLKCCHLLRNSAETSCMTSPEQIEVMKLEGYSGSVCNKHVHSTMTRSSRFHCPIGVINKPTTDRVVYITYSHVYRRLAVVKFSKSTM